MDAVSCTGMRRRRDATQGRRDERGETLALLVVWPALITAILLMLVHAFIVTNARAEAELAASQGLRSAWRVAAESDFLDDPDIPGTLYTGADPHPEVRAMAEAVEDAVARTAATEQGWRWWTPGAAELHSDWCHPYTAPRPGLVQGRHRPFDDQTGMGAGGGVGRGLRAAGRAVAQPVGPGVRLGAGARDPGGTGAGEPRDRGPRAAAGLLSCARPSTACA